MVASMHIHDVGIHIAKMLVGFRLLDKRFLIRLHTFQTISREQDIPIPTRGLSDAVLRQSVNKRDVVAHQVNDPSHLLHNILPVMDEKLQVEHGNGLTRLASAGCCFVQSVRRVAEEAIGIVKHCKHGLAVR